MKPGSWALTTAGILALLLAWRGSVRGVPPATIRFSHKLHVGDEVEAECTTCHQAEGGLASDRMLPTMELCGECHDVDADDSCTACHLDMDDLGEIDVTPQEVVFPHKAHLEYEALECRTCHAGMEGVVKPGGAHLPEMAVCTTCHNGAEAPDQCEACHTDLANRRPESHTHDWPHEHGRRARAGDAACTSCHEQTQCQECHEGAHLSVTLPALTTQATFAPQSRGDAGLILKGTHDLNYRFTHPLDAKGKERECATCHEAATFCGECHRPGSDPAYFRLDWHGGPGWGAIAGAIGSGGGRHADLARRDMERCAACHDIQGGDPICMLCHMDRLQGVGNDVKTHSFRYKSQIGFGDFHDNPNSICFNCHMLKGPPGGAGFCGYCHGSK